MPDTGGNDHEYRTISGWNNGILEFWSKGVPEEGSIGLKAITPALPYSNTPLLFRKVGRHGD
jgi:hypothetical protein